MRKHPKTLKKALLDKRLRAELDHLLRRPPFINEGKRDEGWMCREHSLFVACIAMLQGFVPHICWGQMFVTGHDYATGELKHLRVGTHSWNAIDSFGFLDLSINLKPGEESGWRHWKAKCMMQNKLYPADDAAFHYFVAEDQASFERAASDSVERAIPSIGYLGEEIAILAPNYLQGSVSYINSPLTDELKELEGFSDDTYLRGVWHTWLVLNKRAKPLTALPRRDAWSFVAENYSDASEKLLSLASRLPKE